MSESAVASLEDVVITAELESRACHAPDYASECRALVELAAVMAGTPAKVFQKLVDTALALCQAGSAGISVWDAQSRPSVFRWRATAGAYAQYNGETLPRDFSPCGTVLDRNATQLMADPVRYFPYLSELNEPVREVLLIPFSQRGRAIGTVWTVTHRPDQHFDAEDVRVVTNLTRFAEVAVEVMSRIEETERAHVRQAYFTKLADALRPLSDPREVRATAGQILGEHLKAHRVAYYEVTSSAYTVEHDYSDGVRPLAGRYPIASFGQTLLQTYRAGSTAVEPDVAAAPVLTAEERAAFAAIQSAAYVGVPLVKGGELVAGLTAHSATPRAWTPDEVSLIEQTAERTWEAVARARAETGRRDAEGWMRVASSAAKLGQWTVDLGTSEMIASDGCKANFGLSPEDTFTYDQLWQAVHSEDRDRVQGQVRHAIDTRSEYDTEYRILWPDGSLHWVLVRGRAVYAVDGTPLVITGVTLDVTERRRAEEALQASEELNRSLMDASTDCVKVLDCDGRLLVMNGSGKCAMEIDDFGPVRGRLWQDLWPEEAKPSIEDAVTAAGEGRTSSFQAFCPTAKGAPRWWDVAVGPVRHASDGRVVRVLAVSRDISGQKATEARLRQLADDLAAAGRLKDEFLATLAHELRNPLAPIRTGLSVLRLGDGEARKDVLRMMDRQVGQMVHLVDDLLDVARVNTGKVTLRIERVEVGRIVEQAVEATRPLIDGGGHALGVSLPSDPARVDADPIRLTQILINLLNNAAKYTPPGGHIALVVARDSGDIVIRVSDDGVGIATEMLPQVFNLFTQVGRSLEQAQGGLGIGLSLVRKLVEMHGGTVSAESAGHGRGSTFTVRMPAAAPAPETPRPSDPASPAAAKSRRIVVVDDNVDGAEIMALLLSMQGHHVKTAYNGVVALQAIRELQPDVAFLDIGMPGMSGYDLARAIRRDPTLRSALKLVALTGLGTAEDRQQAKDAGFDDHLAKPVVIDRVNELLDKLA